MSDPIGSGLLNVCKPTGITSRDVVNRVQRLVRPVKVGHAGTLDPLATGVLVVALGSATRLVSYVQEMPKRYIGTFLLGRHSDTEDVTGDVKILAEAKTPTIDEIAAAARQWTGQILQRPPAYSALKVQGRRAHALVRAGQDVELAEREIAIHAIDVVRYEYPELELDVRCGSGTYVRSLGRDIAETVGSAAVMSALVRTEIGCFHLDAALACDDLSLELIAARLEAPAQAVTMLPRIVLRADEIRQIAQGRYIERSLEEIVQPNNQGEIAAIDETGQLVAILLERAPGLLGPIKNFISVN